MTDKKITQLTELTSASIVDLIPIVDDPSGTPEVKKITVGNLLTGVDADKVDGYHAAASGANAHVVVTDSSGKIDNSALNTGSGNGIDADTVDGYHFPLDGWIPANETWTYVSSTSFRISGNVTEKYPKGTKLKLTQTTAKYFYVISTSYSSPNTTVTITGGSDYSLANATINSPYYSYMATPQGFPDIFSWSPTPTGFSSVPGSSVYQFRIDGKQVIFSVHQGTDGTSNATTFTIPLPVTAASGTSWQGTNGFAVNAGTSLTVASRWYIAGGGTVIDLYTDMASGAWTNSGGKRARLQGIFFI